jgi:orotate phosphoribosyltransferase
MAYDSNNIFARILRGEIPCDKVFENDYALAFRDINPQAPVHVLVIPKADYVDLDDFTANAPSDLIAGFFRAVGEVARDGGLVEDGYRALANNGRNAHQEVPHLHIHLFAGRPLGPMLARTDAAGDDRARLLALIGEKSFMQGEGLQLASGAKSTFYFDMKPTMFSPEGSGLIARLILREIAPGSADFIGGLEMGAVPVVVSVVHESGNTPAPLRGLFVRKQPKGHGTQRKIEGLARDEDLRGKKVILVDDVTTTGGSVLKAVEAVRAAGGVVDRVITVVDRQEGAADNLGREGISLTALFSASDFGVK